MARTARFARQVGLAAAVAALALPARAALAQDASDDAPSTRALRLHQAVLGTPIGALVPVAPEWALGLRRRVGLQLRYGSTRFDDDFHDGNVALGMEVPGVGGDYAITIGYKTPTCKADTACPGHILTGASWSSSVLRHQLSPESGGALLALGLDASAGVGLPRDATYASASVGVPLSLVAGGRVRFGPYLVPGVVYALNRSGGATTRGALGAVGGGFTLTGLVPGLGVDLGFQKVLVDGADTEIGVGATWRGLR